MLVVIQFVEQRANGSQRLQAISSKKISLPYQLRNDSLLKQAVAYICNLQKSNGFNHEFNFKEILQVKVHITSQHVAGVFIVL